MAKRVELDPIKIVADARQQVANARMIGEFTVQMGSAEIGRRLGGAQELLETLLENAGLIARKPAPVTSPAPSSAIQTNQTTAASSPATKAQPATKAKSSPRRSPVKKTAKKVAPAKAAPAKKTVIRKSPAKPSTAPRATAKQAKGPITEKNAQNDAKEASSLPEDLGIRDYDTLAASQIVPRLGSLSAAQLEAVLHHERVHRGRKTILGRVAQLQSDKA